MRHAAGSALPGPVHAAAALPPPALPPPAQTPPVEIPPAALAPMDVPVMRPAGSAQGDPPSATRASASTAQPLGSPDPYRTSSWIIDESQSACDDDALQGGSREPTPLVEAFPDQGFADPASQPRPPEDLEGVEDLVMSL